MNELRYNACSKLWEILHKDSVIVINFNVQKLGTVSQNHNMQTPEQKKQCLTYVWSK